MNFYTALEIKNGVLLDMQLLMQRDQGPTLLYIEKTFQKVVCGFMTLISRISLCENKTRNKGLNNAIGNPCKYH